MILLAVTVSSKIYIVRGEVDDDHMNVVYRGPSAFNLYMYM